MGSPTLKTLELLQRLVESQGKQNLEAVAAQMQIPLATAYRYVATLQQAGMVTRGRRGVFVPSFSFLSLVDESVLDSTRAIIAEPTLRRLAKKFSLIVQMGRLRKNMVKYLLKIGRNEETLFTIVGTELEAYCSGLGKAHLAHLPDDAIENYLKEGPFVPLTENTITDPEDIRRELLRVRESGFAEDRGEIESDLFCIAAPITDPDGVVRSAISVSQRIDPSCSPSANRQALLKSSLHAAAKEIEKNLGPCPSG